MYCFCYHVFHEGRISDQEWISDFEIHNNGLQQCAIYTESILTQECFIKFCILVDNSFLKHFKPVHESQVCSSC